MTYIPFDCRDAHPVFEPDGDRVRVTWTEPGARPEDAMLCEAIWSVDELAEAQRGDADLDLDSIRSWPLAEVTATARARLEGLRARRDELVNKHPELKSRRAR